MRTLTFISTTVLSLTLASNAQAQTCIAVTPTTFHPGVDIAHQRTFVANGYFVPAAVQTEQCIEISSDVLRVDIDDKSSTQVQFSVAGVTARRNAHSYLIDTVEVVQTSPKLRVKFKLTSTNARITRIAYQIYLIGKLPYEDYKLHGQWYLKSNPPGRSTFIMHRGNQIFLFNEHGNMTLATMTGPLPGAGPLTEKYRIRAHAAPGWSEVVGDYDHRADQQCIEWRNPEVTIWCRMKEPVAPQ